jgi:SAM-dependent methyltransferase
MGINVEMAQLLVSLRDAGALVGDRIVELGAQEISADPEAIRDVLHAASLPVKEPVREAPSLYAAFGLQHYRAIDLSGERDALAFDLNERLADRYGFKETFDLVTNLGTTEHCFDQRAAFANIHDLCRPGGLMIHAVPSQGWANHGFYAYSPRFFADVAEANGYAIERLGFTVDVRPQIIIYDLAQYRANDARDLMIYAVLRRTADAAFVVPHDSMFRPKGWLLGGAPPPRGASAPEFLPYIKTNWRHVKERPQQPILAKVRGWLGL